MLKNALERAIWIVVDVLVGVVLIVTLFLWKKVDEGDERREIIRNQGSEIVIPGNSQLQETYYRI